MSLRDVLKTPSSEITDEAVYRDRRRLLQLFALTPALGVAGCAEADPPPPPKTVVTPAQARSGFRTAEELTRLEDVTSYNNFYEFGTDKTDPSKAAKTLKLSPWSVKVSGECEKPGSLSLDELLKGIPAEERIYRLRCVEGWSMVIPWTGVPLGEVLKRFAPTSKAKYVAFTTLADPQQMPGVRYRSINWPYREGLRIDEAMHPLTLLATGLYGKPLPQQNGAPLRLVVPWKYGFKSIKSIVEIASSRRCPRPPGMTCSRPNTGSFPTSIRQWTIRAGARRPSGVSPAPPASCSPSASRPSHSTAMRIRSLRCTRGWI